MGSMIYLAVQKHLSAAGSALSLKSLCALKTPEGCNPKTKQNKQQVRGSWDCSSVTGRSAGTVGLANLVTQESGHQAHCLPPLPKSPFQARLICQPQHTLQHRAVSLCARGRCQRLESPRSHPCHSLAGPCKLGTQGGSLLRARSSGSGHDLQPTCRKTDEHQGGVRHP